MDRGQSLIITPLFDGTNYAYWKVHMRDFLQSLDEKVWKVVEIGWTKPKEVPADWDDAKIKVTTFKDSKLQRLTTKFEEIKMEEDESFNELYVNLQDIVNSAFNFGETIYEPKIVRKVLRSLPERFHAKIMAIEE